ncbi:hypothetical protein IJG14_00910 [bacterium]|nr:hypothetical protein [bacterium]
MHCFLFISILLTAFSSLFLTLVFENKKIYSGVCIFGSILFSQVVLNLQLLSLFSIIKPFFIIGLNLIFFVFSFVIWKFYAQKPSFNTEYNYEIEKIKLSIHQDKWLKYSVIAFFVFLIGSIIFMYFMPANDEDALSYHIARLPFWYEAKNLNHFECADIRALIMPINSEIFYFWAYSFIKSDIFVRLFSFLSYIIFVAGLRGFLKELKIPVKLCLWIILSLTAMQSVKFSITGTETNITIAALLMDSMFLFAIGAKYNKLRYLFFSSLLYALAIGTKTPAIQIIPAFFLIYTVISCVFNKKVFYKYLSFFCIFFIVNFILFASYNYILNYIDFGNPIASVHSAEMHKFYGGVKGFFANLFRYCALFIDFSGFPLCVQLWRIKIAFINIIFSLFNIQTNTIDIIPDIEFLKIGNNFENMNGLGVLGFLILLPSLYIAVKRIKHSLKSLIFGILTIAFVINIIILSCSLGYMIYNIRFFMIYAMLASPVLIYAFLLKKNSKFKIFIAVIIMYSFTFSYYFYERRFTPYLLYIFYHNPSIEKFKNKILSANIDFDKPSQAYVIMDKIKSEGKIPVNVLYFAPEGANIYYTKHLENNNLHITFKLLETTDEKDIDWSKYDYIVVPNVQGNTNIKNINKYKNAITKYNDDYDKHEVYYDFDKNIFASCIFLSNRTSNFKWLQEPENKYTSSDCFYRSDILQKHGFYCILKVNSYDKVPKKQLNLYKNFNK